MNIVRILFWCCGIRRSWRIRMWSKNGLLGVIVMLEVVLWMMMRILMIYGSIFMFGCRRRLLILVCVFIGFIWKGIFKMLYWCWEIKIIVRGVFWRWNCRICLFKWFMVFMCGCINYFIVLLLGLKVYCCIGLWRSEFCRIEGINLRVWKLVIGSIVLRYLIFFCW